MNQPLTDHDRYLREILKCEILGKSLAFLDFLIRPEGSGAYPRPLGVVEPTNQSPEIASPELEVESPKTPSSVAEENDGLTEDVYDAETAGDEEEVKVVRFDHGGKSYLKSSGNMLYDPATSELVGCWNPATEEIEEVVEYGTDDEEN